MNSVVFPPRNFRTPNHNSSAFYVFIYFGGFYSNKLLKKIKIAYVQPGICYFLFFRVKFDFNLTVYKHQLVLIVNRCICMKQFCQIDIIVIRHFSLVVNSMQ